jgi:hypothetical protein
MPRMQNMSYTLTANATKYKHTVIVTVIYKDTAHTVLYTILPDCVTVKNKLIVSCWITVCC